MKKFACALATLGVAVSAIAVPTVSNVKVQQRYPWNGLVDITCDIENGTDTNLLYIAVEANDLATGAALPVNTIYLEGKSVFDGLLIAPGSHHIIWDAGTDVPDKDIEDVEFLISASFEAPYIVIDLSGGASASSYPVTPLAAKPVGGWTDEYKTTKLVLRRISAGSFKMNGTHDVTLSKPYYMGVFDVTQKQYSLVTGNNPSSRKGDTRPVETVSYDNIRGSSLGSQWPMSSLVDESSFVGKLRARTHIMTFDLPTEAQWEYASRAGTKTTYYWGDDMDDSYAWYKSNSDSTTHPVGEKKPNAWELYDLNGNVWDWCLDWHSETLEGGIDPKGPLSGQPPYGDGRVIRGGAWDCSAECCTSSHRTACGHGVRNVYFGFRLSMGVEDYMVIDLSAGYLATEYPTTHISLVPSGGWTDEYKTTKLIMRRLEPGTFTMGLDSSEMPADADVANLRHTVALSNPFYIGVFETTQKQYELVTGYNPSDNKGDNHPVEETSYAMVRGGRNGQNWPANSDVDEDSFMGLLRARTGHGGIDLPTEAQWEYACRAGTTSLFNNGGYSQGDLISVACSFFNRGRFPSHAVVGSFAPNLWGIYDMHGNVWELCLDWSSKEIDRPSLEFEIDPVGPSSGDRRIVRGGNYLINDLGWYSSGFRGEWWPSSDDNHGRGFRVSELSSTNEAAVSGNSISHINTQCINWTFSGGAEWNSVFNGFPYVRSGEIGVSTNSTLRTTLEGPGKVSFDWKVSCNYRGHYLQLLVDGEQLARITGETDWTMVELDLPAGEHALEFNYVKGSTPPAGDDFGAVRNFVLGPRYVDEYMRVDWDWTTNYWVRVETVGYGATDFTNGWVAAGETLAVDVIPIIHSYVMTLSGDNEGIELDGTKLSIVVDGAKSVSVAVDEVKPSLIVKSIYGIPSPHVGRTFYHSDEVIEACVIVPEPTNGVQYACMGWSGTGSVPESGTGTNAEFALWGNSTLTWNWTTNFWLELSIVGPAHSAFTNQWVAFGETMMIPFMVDTTFFALSICGDTDGITLEDGTISVPAADRPRHIVLTVDEYTYADAVDARLHEWTSGGESVWTPQTAVTHDGKDAAKSGVVVGADLSMLSTTVNGEGTLSWWWKLDCGNSCGVDIFIDNEWVDGMWETTDWTQCSIEILGEGEHAIRFEFWNAGTQSDLGDCAYLDQVVWSNDPTATATTPEPVPFAWLDRYGLGGTVESYESAALAQAANGVNAVWECYVAGLDPTDPDERLMAYIAFDGFGAPVITWEPDWSGAVGEARRMYTVEGRETLDDGDWETPPAANHRFFRVKAALPK